MQTSFFLTAILFVNLLGRDALPLADDKSPDVQRTIVGVVVNEQGKSVADCEIICRSWDSTGPHTIKSLTDPLGKFEFKPTCKSDTFVKLIAWDPSQRIATRIVDASIGGSDSSKVELRLTNVTMYKTVISDSNGKPLEGAKVIRMENADSRFAEPYFPYEEFKQLAPCMATSDANGEICIPIPVSFGKVSMHIRHSDYAPWTMNTDLASLPNRVELKKGIPIEIQVVGPVDTTDFDMTKCDVNISQDNVYSKLKLSTLGIATYFASKTHLNGRDPRLEEKQIEIEVRYPDFETQRKSVSLVDVDSAKVQIQLVSSVKVKATLLDEDSKPVEGVFASLNSLKDRLYSEYKVSDEHGNVEFVKPMNIATQFRIQSSEFQITNENEFAKAASESGTSFQVKLRKRRTIRLCVIGEDGKPVSDALVVLMSPQSIPQKPGFTDPFGIVELFETDGLAVVYAYHPTKPESCALNYKNVVSHADDALSVCRMELLEEDSFRVQILDVSDKPIKNTYGAIQGFLQDVDESLRFFHIQTVASDENGDVDIRGLPWNGQFALEIPGLPREPIPIRRLSGYCTLDEDGLETNRSVMKRITAEFRETEIQASKWWNTEPLQLQAQNGKFVVLLEVSDLGSQSQNALLGLQWMHDHYREKGLVAIARISSKVGLARLESLIQAKKWTFPICLSIDSISRTTTHLIEPKAGKPLTFNELYGDLTVMRIRNRMVHGQKIIGRQ